MTREDDINYWLRDSIWGSSDNMSLHRCWEWLLKKWVLNEENGALKDKKLLSGGCATGRIEFYMEQMGARNIEAFDFVPEFVEMAKRNASSRKSNINFFIGDMLKLSSIDTANQDCIVYLNRLVCFVDSAGFKKTLSEIHRTLRPGGLLIFDALDYGGRKWNGLFSLLLTAAWALQGHKKTPRMLPRVRDKNQKINKRLWKTDQNLLYWFTKEELEDKLTSAGFKILEFVKEADIFPDPKDSIIFYLACVKE